MSENLKGRHAIVTGGGTGIGEAIARALHAAGARVTVMGRTAATLQLVASSLGGGQAIVADITQAKTIHAAFAKAGPADILINNAGNAESAPFARTDAALWERMLSLNLTGAFLCTHEVLPHMRTTGWGRIVNIASTAAHKGYPYVTAYCAAKHGLLGFTRALALETAREGITVNAVSPGFTETGMLAASVETISATTGHSPEKVRAQLLRNNPQARFIPPTEVAASVVWLCLPSSGAVTGQSLSVSGGEVMA